MSTQNETGYRALKVWQRAMDLTLASYGVVARLPEVEKYDLGSQIRRSAVSVPANIAEGYARDHLGESLHHLAIAAGSLAELQTLLLITLRLGYIDGKQSALPLSLAMETERMLHRFRNVLRGRRDRHAPLHTSRRG
ncbi:MAG TPA: four helix bundle protein [Gemmatimonadaceae bacterium]|jgi:four helix bundle protein|nr:four helix bundle protein [Gemmatimonadaceae bacterium]